MKLISLKQAEKLLKKSIKTNKPRKITFLTKKKDRSLALETAADSYFLTEKGYYNQVKELKFDNLENKHIVNAAFKREFPRSHWVYLIEK
ncbi:hypothetical protein [Lactobacillus intestinalis]|uniref:hypothetical protein n=1 Tax=Lactobacillus intestinalis TaxID=151781 RepID=UPI001F5AA4C5|nr:hypothetical protein [Lactobacillus intestinalis]